MVYLEEIIKKYRNELLADDSVQRICYEYITNKDNTDLLSLQLSGQEEEIAAQGYKGIQIPPLEIESILNKKPIKGIDFTTDIYKLLGIHLATNGRIQSRVNKKFEDSSLKYKYLIAKVLPEFLDKWHRCIAQIEKEKDPYATVFCFLSTSEQALDYESALQEIVNRDLDLIDLLILEDVQRLLIKESLYNTKIINLSAVELILNILQNFGNTVKKITRERRKGHDNFEINDEYDVQDILYIMLKPIFPQLIIEEPTPKVGPRYNLIDLVIRDEGIIVEAKMIKESDTDEKKFIEQLKIDIQSYYLYDKLKHLLVFVYDPQNKTKDINAFYNLNGVQEIHGIKFTINVIVDN